MKKLPTLTGGLLMEVITIWVDGNASTMGAAVAYYTIFTIAPLFIFVHGSHIKPVGSAEFITQEK